MQNTTIIQEVNIMEKFKLIIEADYALFTRPEMKVERVSYGRYPSICSIFY